MLLALDTATRLISIALHDGQALVAESTWQAGAYHTVELAPQVALMLRRAEVEPAQLRGVAVAIGPGSYTGLRIGLGFAKGLALAHALPLAGVPTLDSLMRAQPPRAERALALLQAGRGRVSAAAYQWRARTFRWEATGETRVLAWADLATELSGAQTPVYVVGEIDAAGAELLRPLRGRVLLASPAQSLRRAGYLAELGWERLRSAPDDAVHLAPIYGGQPIGAAPAAPATAIPAASEPAELAAPAAAPATTAPEASHDQP
jgi:tRNA threonylcarbamoyladenosine biosynthesis protein TsaB